MVEPKQGHGLLSGKGTLTNFGKGPGAMQKFAKTQVDRDDPTSGRIPIPTGAFIEHGQVAMRSQMPALLAKLGLTPMAAEYSE